MSVKAGDAQTASASDALFPDLVASRALRSVDRPETLLHSLEFEILSRSRLLVDAELPNAISYRHARPEDPLPFLLVVVDHVPDELSERFRATRASAASLGIGVLTLGSERLSAASITVDTTQGRRCLTPGLHQALRHAVLLGSKDSRRPSWSTRSSRLKGPA